jgi:biopolymer transport protein ExbD
MAFHAPGKNAAQINVTPLIDILLVLLITFLLITPVNSIGEEARIPRDDPRQPADPDVVVLQLSLTTGSVGAVQLAINHQKVEWSALGDTLQQTFKTRGDKTLFLVSDRDIDFRYIAQVTDAAHAAGAENVALVPAAKR